MRSFLYFLKESFRGFKRSASTSFGSVITIFLSLFIIGVFLVAVSFVNNIVSDVEGEVSITAYVADEAAQESIDQVMADLSATQGVASVTFKTKDEALESFQESNGTELIDSLDGVNPLPASICVELDDPQAVDSIAASLAESPLYAEITDNPDDPSEAIRYGQKTVEKLFSVTKYVRYAGIALIIMLVFIALVFINNTIRLAILARRKEISIMRLVGASNSFIRGPFLTEGALHAVIGAALASACLEVIRQVGLPALADGIEFLNVTVEADVFFGIYVLLFVFGLVIGLVGSALAMRRYLKV